MRTNKYIIFILFTIFVNDALALRVAERRDPTNCSTTTEIALCASRYGGFDWTRGVVTSSPTDIDMTISCYYNNTDGEEQYRGPVYSYTCMEPEECPAPDTPSPIPEGALTPTVGEMPDCDMTCPGGYISPPTEINGGTTCLPECQTGEQYNHETNQCETVTDTDIHGEPCTTYENVTTTLCIDKNIFLQQDQAVDYEGCAYIEKPGLVLYASTSEGNESCRIYRGTGAGSGSITTVTATTGTGDITITDNNDATGTVDITTLNATVTYDSTTTEPSHSEAIDNSIDQLLATPTQYDTDRDTYPEEYQNNSSSTDTVTINGIEYQIVRHVDEPINTGQPYNITSTSTATDGNGNTTTSTTTTTVNPVDGEDSGGIYTVFNGGGTGTNTGDDTGTNNGDGTGTNNGDATGTDTTAIEAKLDTANTKLAKIQEGLDGTGSNVSFDCKIEPTCDPKVVTCANLKQEWFTACGGTEAIETAITEAITALGEDGNSKVQDINIASIITDITNYDVTASCPPDVIKTINILSASHSLTIRSEPYCNFATTIRPAVLMVGSFLVLLIIARMHR